MRINGTQRTCARDSDPDEDDSHAPLFMCHSWGVMCHFEPTPVETSAAVRQFIMSLSLHVLSRKQEAVSAAE